MAKPVILTGLRSNNDLHLGNYLGALKPIVDLAHKYGQTHQINVFVPDLHSFTTPVDHSQLHNQTIGHLKNFVAAGLDLNNPNIYLYRQSFIPAHSEMTWILDCFAYMGELKRMTQFKEKSQVEGVSVGLFNYPVLMAADILLYSAEFVPVGDDQTQHVELARDLALRLNEKFKTDLLSPPANLKSQLEFASQNQRLRLRDLARPEQKMSKSADSDKGIIFLSDSGDTARQKILAATTDSDNHVRRDYTKQPGVSNLVDIIELLGGNVADFEAQTEYGQLKTAAADLVEAFLSDYQKRLAAVDEKQLIAKVEASEAAMAKIANTTLYRVQKAVGLRA